MKKQKIMSVALSLCLMVWMLPIHALATEQEIEASEQAKEQTTEMEAAREEARDTAQNTAPEQPSGTIVEPNPEQTQPDSTQTPENNGVQKESAATERSTPSGASGSLSLQPFAAGYVAFSFELTTAAVAGTSTYPGATVQIKATHGDQYISNDYFTNSKTSSTYVADSDTRVSFVINYLSRLSSNDGSGIGKITGSFDVDSNDAITNVTAKNLVGGSVASSITGTGTQIIKLTNPNENASVEWTTVMDNRIGVDPSPSDASFDFYDERDDSRIPMYAVIDGKSLWGFPVSKANGGTNTVKYVVKRSGYDTAQGSIKVTRTSASLYYHSLELVPDGSEVSASITIENTTRLKIALKKQPVDYGVTFSIKSTTPAKVTMTMDGETLLSSESSNYKYVIPLVTVDAVVDYEISATEFKTIKGQLKLKPDGSIEDITDQAAKDGTVSYSFDSQAQQLKVEMLPSVIGAPSSTPGMYEAEVSGLFGNIFTSDSTSVSTLITGGMAQRGRLEVTNPDPLYKSVIVDVRVEGYASMNHNVLRIETPITRFFTDEAPEDMGEYMRVRDIVKYANAKISEENFQTYYDCLLYYFQKEAGYSTISSLDELDLEGLSMMFPSFSGGVGNYTLDLKGYDGVKEDIDYNNTGRGVLIESEDRIQELALKLLNEYALYFTLDDIVTGELPIVSSAAGSSRGLQFSDYLENTDTNKAQIASILNGIVLNAGGSYVFENIAFSTLGDYLHNHFYLNGLVLDFTLYFTMARVGIDGIVFEDANENGVYDNDEPIHEGVSVRLYSEGDMTNALATTTTDVDGYYLFEDINILQNGNYVVQIDLPDGKTVTVWGPTGAGDDNVFTQNSDGSTANSKTIAYVVNTNARANAGLKNTSDMPPADNPDDPADENPDDPADENPIAPNDDKPNDPVNTDNLDGTTNTIDLNGAANINKIKTRLIASPKPETQTTIHSG